MLIYLLKRSCDNNNIKKRISQILLQLKDTSPSYNRIIRDASQDNHPSMLIVSYRQVFILKISILYLPPQSSSSTIPSSSLVIYVVGMKLAMMRHRSRLYRTFLCCMVATGSNFDVFLCSSSSNIIAEGKAAIAFIGSGWRMLPCCDACEETGRSCEPVAIFSPSE